ncbi:MAG: Leader peptidase (Prepilin peptidase) / N-methyltransferase [uncultured Truepera sp.]|uniref:Leader peptidase (Prepilin peptidase) / N-methyltransferase n=1 Tax=uncultured Truepera sp. TaxID=543023 RepID=A0A6J4VFX3_9DEIN|nr:MAG: Leader peptidase (Prepilin peptidase) / N-methyltransferase [uncultured Truepera sp.]
MLTVLTLALLGALIGSFANVVIYRLPRGESVVFPGSHCPHCGRALGALELVPVASWAALGGRCRVCKAGISARYPLVETLMALGFAALALRYPVEVYGLTVFPLLALFALLVILFAIDLDTHLLPDALTLPALGVALLGTLLYAPGSGLPTMTDALYGACLGAGVLALLNRLGALVLRRFRDTRERLWPIGMDQVNVAAPLGTLGWPFGFVGAALSLALNALTRRTLRLPELPLYALWLIAVTGLTLLRPNPLSAVSGSLVAAGGTALVGALYWWLHDLGRPTDEIAEEEDEPVAMGFGDVKLAGVLGALLGAQNLLVALSLAFVFGAVGGLIGKALGGGHVVPFGPYLVSGALAALFYGGPLVGWYLGLLGF